MDLFNSKKKQQEQEAQNKLAREKAEQAQKEQDKLEFESALEKKALKVGLNGTSDAFYAAWKESALPAVRENLRTGAIQAFNEGRPENVQFIMQYAEHLQIKTYELLLTLTENKTLVQSIEIIERALAKSAEHVRQNRLDTALRSHIACHSADKKGEDFGMSNKIFLRALVEAGAHTSGPSDEKGRPLAWAITFHTPEVVKYLHVNGAEYKDALLLMQVEDWEQFSSARDCIKKLRAYQEYDRGDVVTQLQQNLADVTQRLEKAEQQILALASEKAAAPKPTHVTLRPVTPPST